MLLGGDGYIMMADFGLSRVRKDEEDPNSFCGTPEYLGKNFTCGDVFSTRNDRGDWSRFHFGLVGPRGPHLRNDRGCAPLF